MGDESTITDREDDVHVRVLLPDGGQEELPEDEEEDEDEEEKTDENGETEGEEEDDEEEAEDDKGSEDEEAEENEDEEDEEAEEGEEETEEDEEESEDEEGDEETEEDEDAEQAEGEEEAEDEGEVDEEDRDAAESEEGTRVLHLNLDGLFLDLLGLEVDLDEVRLNITAIPGDGNLVGNLLSAVGGLLDGGDLGEILGLDDMLGGGLLGGEDDDGLLGNDLLGGEDEEGEEGESGGLLPDLDLAGRIEAFGSAIAERLRDFFGGILDELPLEDLATQFVQELVNQLLGTDDEDGGNGDGDEAASA